MKIDSEILAQQLVDNLLTSSEEAWHIFSSDERLSALTKAFSFAISCAIDDNTSALLEQELASIYAFLAEFFQQSYVIDELEKLILPQDGIYLSVSCLVDLFYVSHKRFKKPKIFDFLRFIATFLQEFLFIAERSTVLHSAISIPKLRAIIYQYHSDYLPYLHEYSPEFLDGHISRHKASPPPEPEEAPLPKPEAAPTPAAAPLPTPAAAPLPTPAAAPLPTPVAVPPPMPEQALPPEPVASPLPEPATAPPPKPATAPPPKPEAEPQPKPIRANMFDRDGNLLLGPAAAPPPTPAAAPPLTEITRYGRAEYFTPMDVGREYLFRFSVFQMRLAKFLLKGARVHWSTLRILSKEDEPIIRITPSSGYFTISPPFWDLKISQSSNVSVDFRITPLRTVPSPAQTCQLHVDFHYQGKHFSTQDLEVKIQDPFSLGPFKFPHHYWVRFGLIGSGVGLLETTASMFDLFSPLDSHFQLAILSIGSILAGLFIFIAFLLWKQSARRVKRYFTGLF